jgi:L-threonylcarbamoyladenylate synthase
MEHSVPLCRNVTSQPPPLVTPDAAGIARAAAALDTGELVAFPTETVYGLGGDATSDTAIAAIFEAKGRPRFNPLIVHVAHMKAAEALVKFDDRARKLASAFWPGALTLVLPRRDDCPVSLLASAGLHSLALRVPAHGVALNLLAAFTRPVAAPSANLSGYVSPTTASHVTASLGNAVALILGGGPCAIGLESTVIGLTEGAPVLLRPGGVTAEEVEAITGPLDRPHGETDATPSSPGRLLQHYAPGRPLRLDAVSITPGEALLSFGPHAITGAAAELNLSSDGDLREAAANLFAMLRELDNSTYRAIAVMAVPKTGLGLAINDRLHRAAKPTANPKEAAS